MKLRYFFIDISEIVKLFDAYITSSCHSKAKVI